MLRLIHALAALHYCPKSKADCKQRGTWSAEINQEICILFRHSVFFCSFGYWDVYRVFSACLFSSMPADKQDRLESFTPFLKWGTSDSETQMAPRSSPQTEEIPARLLPRAGLSLQPSPWHVCRMHPQLAPCLLQQVHSQSSPCAGGCFRHCR